MFKQCAETFQWTAPVSRSRTRSPWIIRSDKQVWQDPMVPCRHYYPLRDEPALYRVFASTPTTLEGMQGFAARYGLLDVRLKPGEARPLPLWGWTTRIDEMAAWVQTLDECQNLPPGDASEAIIGVCDGVNAELARFFAPRLVPLAGGPGAFLQFNLTTLWDAMVLQLAMAILNGTQYRPCAVCQKPIPVHHKMGEEDRTACSQACRQRLFRQRRDQAIRWHQEGVSFREIAARLQTDAATVKGWIRSARKPQSGRASRS